ncbi:MAG: hypothetical protein LBM03_01180 [Erysipelotrichaceae bacterium]|jgi:hypothetical protein|nr:hypothetical protein [Erysipelotrichaceae bacterium]
MKNIVKFLIIPLVLGLASCGEPTVSTSSDVVVQDDWTEEDKITMASQLGGLNIPFSSIFVNDGREYTISEYYNVSKVSVECLLPVKNSEYDPLNDVDAYKNFCIDDGFVLDDDASNVDDQDYVLTLGVDSGSEHIDSTMYLEIYLSSSNYLTVDAWVETIYTTSFWPSRSNLDKASLYDLLSIEELLAKDEGAIPSLDNLPNNSLVEFIFGIINGNISVSLTITSTTDVKSDYIALLTANSYILDESNSTNDFDDYYSKDFLVDVYVYKNVSSNTYKMDFISY